MDIHKDPGNKKSFELIIRFSLSASMSSWIPSLNALRAFEATARHRSYKGAADELSVTPAAIKQLVAKLEDAIGEPLLRRSGRAMELTDIGIRGLDDLSNGFRQIAQAVDRMRSTRHEKRLVVSVVPRLESFKLLHPTIEVLIDSSMQLANLIDGSTNVGIRFGVEDHGELVAHRLFDEELCALCSPMLAEGPPPIRKLEDLANAKLLRWDLSEFKWSANTRNWNYWKTWLSAVGAEHVSPARGLKFNDYNLAVQAAVAGQGFVLGSKPVLASLLETGLLIDPFSHSAKPGIGYDVVTTKDALERADVRCFIDWILDRSA
ncbi:MAG: LysR substrate-binding domain-containing protein [Alphaproteobacteria bacterium]